jgi:hypothetical protein
MPVCRLPVNPGEGRIFLQFPVEGQREKYFLNRDFFEFGSKKGKMAAGRQEEGDDKTREKKSKEV